MGARQMVKKAFTGGDKLQAKLAEILKSATSAKQVDAGFLTAENAEIAFYNEFGTEDIPPRPFMRQTAKTCPDGWVEDLADAMKTNGMDADKALRVVGRVMCDDIQIAMRDFTDPPNAASTIARKGFDNPLIGPTKGLLNSVDFEVKS